MPRLYITLLSIYLGTVFSVSFSQSELKKYIEFAEEKHQKGDFIQAIDYYQKAMNIDSNAVDLIWKYALTLKAYKDYRNAAYYFGEVFDREGGKIYPESLLYYGLMLKQCSRYDEALEVFKKGKKLYRSDRRGYLYLKTRQELSSCLWAKNAIKDTSNIILEDLPEHINTPDAEFAHRLQNDVLYFSSLKADSVSKRGEVYATEYKTKLYTSELEDSVFGEVKLLEDIAAKTYNSGNGSFSPDGKRFYFSNCETNNYNYTCKIMVAQHEQGKFKNIDELGEVINEPNSNTTMPYCTIMDGEEVLFFSSDREGGKGKMDLWYSRIKKGNQYSKPKNIKRLNTMDSELSPYYDSDNEILYFSSSWHDGFGGFDIFKSEYDGGRFEAPENLGYPFNSPANDLYFFKTQTKDTSFFSSNRLGVNYSKNPTCCSDIFLARKPIDPPPPTIEETLEDLNKRLPVTLYFHNDIPDPRSWDTTSNVNYMDAYNDYIAMLEKYQKEYAEGLRGEEARDAEDDIEDFFIEYVQQGVKDLQLFKDLLYEELLKGRQFRLTVKGFASPLAKTDYNVNLTKRRIASLINYLKVCDDGKYVPFFEGTHENGGRIEVVEIPFGEYKAATFTSDNPNDQRNSVYSRAAAIERKIEIQSIEKLRKEEDTHTLIAKPPIFDAGKVEKGEVVETTFTIVNDADFSISINGIKTSSDNISTDFEDDIIEANSSIDLKVKLDTSEKSGKNVSSLFIKYFDKELRLIISCEVE